MLQPFAFAVNDNENSDFESNECFLPHFNINSLLGKAG